MKLKVENLARIKEAEVELKNLTLFVGQNSTHKSYMAHTVYELLTILNHTSEELTKEKNIILQDEYFKSAFLLNFIIDKRYVKESNRSYTHIIFSFKENREQFDNLIKNFFYLSNIAITKLINKSFNSNINNLESLTFEQNLELDNLFIETQYELEIFKDIDSLKDDLIIYMFLSDLLDKIFSYYEKSLSYFHDIQYFPASRTGFVLAFDEIVSGLLRDKYKGQSSSARLTKPTIDFITKYSDIRTNKFDFSFLPKFDLNSEEDKKIKNSLINFLQKNIIKGIIEEEKLEDNYKNFYLKTEDEVKLDLHLSSSATLETLPFVVFLKDNTNIKNTFFVIEEPEAHLHPKAQIQMAKFIVMLSNTGAKVLVTTHSDYILNEINNCIKLNSLEKENEFSISKDDVSAYLFKNEKNSTSVLKLEIDKYGISNDNFDEVLDELLDRSSDLDEKILENE